MIDEFNADNFDHTGLGFFGGGYTSSPNVSSPASEPMGTPQD